MKITNIVYNSKNPNPSLREDFEKNIATLAENLAIAMAEQRRWEAIQAVASESLQEGMDLLEIKELRSSLCTFKNHDEGLEVEYHGEPLH